MSEGLQVHLATKVVIPAVPASEKIVDGKTVRVPATPERTVQIRGMSGRAVRYRTLNPDEINKAYDFAATMLGEGASQRQFSLLGRMYLCYSIVTEYSDPTDDPLDPKLKWHTANAGDFMKSPDVWSAIFTAKDTTFLQKQYSDWHEMSSDEVDLLAGKAIPITG